MTIKNLLITGDTHKRTIERLDYIRENMPEYIPEETAVIILGDSAFNFYLLDETKKGHKKTDFLSDLIGDKNHSYYLIEDWVEDTNSHYVIMLRDVRRIEYSVAQKIKKPFLCIF